MNRSVFIASVALIAVALSGCEDRTTQDARIARILPEGCTITNLGEYRDLKELVIVCCAGATSTANFRWDTSNGKTTSSHYGAAATEVE